MICLMTPKITETASPMKGAVRSKKTNVIFVDIPDIPGSIAQTAAILADHDLSIKNIGIMHSREFQQGALKIEFYDEQTANDAVRVLKR